MRQGTSLIPIGQTPGCLFKGIRQQATKVVRPSGWTASVQIRCPTAARAEHKVTEADLKEQRQRRQAYASKPEGPAALVVCNEAARIASASKPSNRIGFTALGGPGNKVEGSGDLPRECLSRRIFLVVLRTSLPYQVISPAPGHSNPALYQKSGKRDNAEQHVHCLEASND